MAKKKMQTPEDAQVVSIPEDEGLNQLVWMVKTRTSSSGPLGDYYKGGKYQVPFNVFIVFHRLNEAELCEDQ